MYCEEALLEKVDRDNVNTTCCYYKLRKEGTRNEHLVEARILRISCRSDKIWPLKTKLIELMK